MQRILWTACLFGGILVSGFMLMRLVSQYMDYKANIVITEDKSRPSFPDVSFCTMNPPLESLAKLTPVGGGASLTYPQYLTRVEDFRNKAVLNGQYETAELIQIRMASLSSYLLQFVNNLTMIVPEVLRDCIWLCGGQVVPCIEHGNIQAYVTETYGLCFTVGPPETIREDLDSMSAILFMDEYPHMQYGEQYILDPIASFGRGITILVHPPRSLPAFDSYDSDIVRVSPGKETTLRLEPHRRQSLNLPYMPCTKKSNLTKMASARKTPPKHKNKSFSYTRNGCKHYCFQDHMDENCNCIDYLFMYDLHEIDQFNFCDRFDFSDENKTAKALECADENGADMRQVQVCEQQCDAPCNSLKYKLSMYSVPWPINRMHADIYEKYLANSSLQKSVSDDRDGVKTRTRSSKTRLIQKHLLQVNIILNVDGTHVVSDQESLSLYTFFGNLGGVLNLWVGVTFITFAEVLDFAFGLIFTRNRCSERPAITR